MENEQKRVQFIDSTYMIEEMISQFEETNASANKTLEELQSAISQLESIKEPSNTIKQAIETLKKQVKDITEAIRKNVYRCDCLKPILVLVQQTKLGEDNNVRFIISMLLEAIGAVNRDAKPFEERTELKSEESKEEEVKA